MKKERIEDVGCGLVVLSSKAIKELDFTHNGGYKGYTVDAWIKIQARVRGWPIEQFPVNVTYYEKTPLKKGILMFLSVTWFLIWEGLRYNLWKYKNYIHWLNNLGKLM